MIRGIIIHTCTKVKTITNLLGVKSVTKKHITINIWILFNKNLLSNFYIQDQMLYRTDGRLFRNLSLLGPALGKAELCLERTLSMTRVGDIGELYG